MAEGRTWSSLMGGGDAGGVGGPLIPGVRGTPAYEPAPNSQPLGADTGAPTRTLYGSRIVSPASIAKKNGPTLIVPPTPENRIAILTAPAVGYTIYIGDANVSPLNGLPLPPGQPYDSPLPGLQPLFAVTDAPVYLKLGLQVAPVLAAERQRKTSGIGP